tara:strand:+ start:997 stop:1677 length:681 start_codon:yes stop_codon:yes gene_type:complete
MQSKLKVYAFIFARKNSKRIKNKNLTILLNKTLLERSINFAKNLKFVDKIFVSTDSEKISKKAIELKCEVIKRPKNLTHSKSPEIESWRHAIDIVQKKSNERFIFLSLPTTSPLRRKKDIIKCVDFIKQKKHYDCCITVTKTNLDPYFNMLEKKGKTFATVFRNSSSRTNRKFYSITTVCYCAKTSFVKKAKNVLDGKIKYFEVKFPYSIDIDEVSDLKIAKAFLK